MRIIEWLLVRSTFYFHLFGRLSYSLRVFSVSLEYGVCCRLFSAWESRPLTFPCLFSSAPFIITEIVSQQASLTALSNLIYIIYFSAASCSTGRHASPNFISLNNAARPVICLSRKISSLSIPKCFEIQASDLPFSFASN